MHRDVCGPMPVMSMGGALCFLTFIDDYSRKVWAYAIKRKDEELSIFKCFVTLIETQCDKKVKCLQSYNGGKYISKDFYDFCDMKKIKWEFTAPYNPPQNDVLERMNRTIQEKLRSMFSYS